ncbi:HCP-like protein [Cytidiella melzeri]|nr:HCP-like protein [Cytidiella melzeri]
MVSSKRDSRARKAAYIAFGLVALAAVSCATNTENGVHEEQKSTQIIDTAAEAARAYKQAITTLHHVNAPYAHREDHIDLPYTIHNYSPSFWSTLLPNIQGQGPIATAFRIVLKLRHQTLLPGFVTKLLDRQTGSSRRREEDLSGKAVKVLDLLQHAADLGHTDALYTLAHISLFPPNPHFPSNPELSYKAFSEHALLTGNATSQGYLAFLYSTGYHNATAADEARAHLYLSFAAHGGHKGSEMTMGYRHWSGIGVVEDCMSALTWYEDAAEQSIAKYQTGPPGGLSLPLIPPRLSDLEGGVYGPGASVASTGPNAARPVIKTANARAAGETWEDLLEYYSYNADRGELDFAYRLGKIFYQGSIYGGVGGIASGGDGASRVPRDYHRARQYFMGIARAVWPKDPANPRASQPSVREQGHVQGGYAAAAAGYIGRMFLRGEGVKQDPVLARMWFERGADFGEKESHNGLGIIWRDGLVDGRKDMNKALQHFGLAANQDLAEAYVHIGRYHYDRNEFKNAAPYFETAIRQGSPYEAYYYLASIQARVARSNAVDRQLAASACSVGVSFFKMVAERGVWDDNILREAEIAWNMGTEHGKELALLLWWIAAERGIEVAQNNLAYVLDQDRSILRFTRFAPHSLSNDTARLALTQWTRSAAQHNIDSLVKVGDYYYHGLGVSDEPTEIRYEKAAGFYQSAAGTGMSALALWNLGYMYENGVGVPQDYHLAKRHYDQALDVNTEAYIPVTISLAKLRAKSLWYTLFGGADNLNLWHYDEEIEHVYHPTPPPPEIDAGRERETQADPRKEEEQYVDDGRPWYPGRAREEFNRKLSGRAADALNQDDDPVQWARDRRLAENERDGDYGPDEYFDGATRKYRDDDTDDQFWETMLLVILTILVSALLYVRGRWVERMRREEQARQQQGNGVPPRPSDGSRPRSADEQPPR